ncbi:sigma-70 family RNA polymerase sigma factor [Sorangium sp. So ce1024]|uniref:sigma-70 family RNA polymerase sigma factor n=1 Tax=Sorangium sp. So ce1024 TaxID=3133327 RepID=UPI003F045E78
MEQVATVSQEQESAWLSQYVDAELRTIGVILRSASGGELLAAIISQEDDDLESRRERIQEICADLRGQPSLPDPAAIARMLDEIRVSRQMRAHLLAQVNVLVGTTSCPSGNDPDWVADYRTCYDEVLRLRAKLVESNMRLVHWFVAQRRPSSLDQRDLLLAGTEGLLRTIIYFDPAYGTRLSTYASAWIKMYIGRTVREIKPVLRSPEHIHINRGRLLSARLLLWDELGREPTVGELSERCKRSVKSVEDVLATLRPARSPDRERTPAGEPIGEVAYDERWPTPAQAEARVQLGRLLHTAVKQLAQRNKVDRRIQEILILRFGLLGREGWTLKEIGDKFSVSRERIRQLEEKALGDLVHRFGSEIARLLPVWLDQLPPTMATIRSSPSSSEDGGKRR